MLGHAGSSTHPGGDGRWAPRAGRSLQVSPAFFSQLADETHGAAAAGVCVYSPARPAPHPLGATAAASLPAVPLGRSARRLNAPDAALYQRQEPGKPRGRRSHWLPPPTCLPAAGAFVSFSCRPHGGSGKVGAAPPDAEDPVAA